MPDLWRLRSENGEKAVRKQIPQRKSKVDRQIEAQLEVFRAQTEARYRIALAAYEAQDIPTKDALDRIRDRLQTMSTGQIRVFPNGKARDSYVVEISQTLVDQNILYMATEIVKDLAFMDIRVANYQFPTVYCAECGDKLVMKKRKKAKV